MSNKPSHFYITSCKSQTLASYIYSMNVHWGWRPTVRWKFRQEFRNLRGRNLWLQDWAVWPEKSHPINANSAYYFLSSFFLSWLIWKNQITQSTPWKTTFVPYIFLKLCKDPDVPLRCVARKCWESNLNLLTPTLPRAFLFGANNWNWSRTKFPNSPGPLCWLSFKFTQLLSSDLIVSYLFLFNM